MQFTIRATIHASVKEASALVALLVEHKASNVSIEQTLGEAPPKAPRSFTKDYPSTTKLRCAHGDGLRGQAAECYVAIHTKFKSKDCFTRREATELLNSKSLAASPASVISRLIRNGNLEVLK